jgi:TetR/AcrR family transcriptional regulator, cholesterol catabolism regulator
VKVRVLPPGLKDTKGEPGIKIASAIVSNKRQKLRPGLSNSEISNTKDQIPNKSQIPIKAESLPENQISMNYAEFQKQVSLSRRDICREVYSENRKSIRVKKEDTVVRNLERIFNATLKISNQKGFQAMSMRDLSRETHLSMGALYSYFSSKEELLAMLQHQRRMITKRILQKHIQKETDPPAKLRAAVLTHLHLSEAMQPWFYFSYMEAKNLSKKEQDLAVASELYTESILAGILKEGQDLKFFVISDVQLTACVVKAMLQDWYLKRSKYARRNITVDQYAHFILQFIEAFILKIEKTQ